MTPLFSKLKALFIKPKKETPLGDILIANKIAEALRSDGSFSYSNDPTIKFGSLADAIPELSELLTRLNRDKSLTFFDVATYFKYFENDYNLKSPLFRLKSEFLDNTLFSIDNANLVTDNDNNILGLNLVVKEELTGMRIYIEAPTTFFAEFANSVEMPKQTVH